MQKRGKAPKKKGERGEKVINYNDKCWYCFYHYLSFVNHLPKRENSRGLRHVYYKYTIQK